MFNSNISLGAIDIRASNFRAVKNGNTKSINGDISVGLSINQLALDIIMPLVNKAIKYESDKMDNRAKIQKELDSLELLELEIRRARLEKELESLRK